MRSRGRRCEARGRESTGRVGSGGGRAARLAEECVGLREGLAVVADGVAVRPQLEHLLGGQPDLAPEDLEQLRGARAGGLVEGGVLVEAPEGELDRVALRQGVVHLVEVSIDRLLPPGEGEREVRATALCCECEAPRPRRVRSYRRRLSTKRSTSDATESRVASRDARRCSFEPAPPPAAAPATASAARPAAAPARAAAPFAAGRRGGREGERGG